MPDRYNSIMVIRYVAFLRGINVGGRTVKMADLRECFETMGFGDVTTYLQTGNVVFESDSNDITKILKQIEQGVSEWFGYDAKILVYPIEILPGVINRYPFDSSNEAFQYYVVFMEGNAANELAHEAGELDEHIEQIQAQNGVLYWRVKRGMTLRSAFSKYLTKAPYKESHTVRNIKTLKKLLSGKSF